MEKKKDLSYYLVLYTLEGHATWRAHLGQDKDSFQRSIDSQHQGVQPNVTAKNIIRIDRLTGQIIPLP